MQLFLISGLSGSGKSVALKVLEDSGYYCVDNLPAELLPVLMENLQQAGNTPHRRQYRRAQRQQRATTAALY